MSKGGTGKTTTAINLAAGLARHDRRVLLIDCDVQGQVATGLGVEAGLGLAEFVRGDADMSAVLIEARPELYLMAGGRSLVGLEWEIARVDFRSEETIGIALRPLDEYFDYVLLDTAPGYSPLLINVFFYATEVLCPVTLQTMAVHGLLTFVKRLAAIRKHHDVYLSYVLPIALDRRYAQTGEIMGELEAHFNTTLCDPIRTGARLSEAPAHGQHIFEHAPRSNGAADYEELTRRVLRDE